MTSKIKYSSTTNKPYIIIKNKKYFGFTLDKVPQRFCEEKKKDTSIRNWFNWKGFTFISREDFVDMYGNYTIE